GARQPIKGRRVGITVSIPCAAHPENAGACGLTLQRGKRYVVLAADVAAKAGRPRSALRTRETQVMPVSRAKFESLPRAVLLRRVAAHASAMSLAPGGPRVWRAWEPGLGRGRGPRHRGHVLLPALPPIALDQAAADGGRHPRYDHEGDAGPDGRRAGASCRPGAGGLAPRPGPAAGAQPRRAAARQVGSRPHGVD